MTRKYELGDELKSSVETYMVIKILNSGNLALSYLAERQSDSTHCFLKQYKSPSPTIGWYKAWIVYQDVLNKRLLDTEAKNYSFTILEAFERAHPKSLQPNNPRYQSYHQVFSLVTEGMDLKAKLEEKPGWDERLRYAIEFVFALIQIHKQHIVHTDLKPENVFVQNLITHTENGQIKLIDFDFAIMTDVVAPWHEEGGYVGTLGYMSPEHIRGEIPNEASDVFTAGLILYELLTDVNPYMNVENVDILSFSVQPPVFLNSTGSKIETDLCMILHRMLDPDTTKRPKLFEVYELLQNYKFYKDTSPVSVEHVVNDSSGEGEEILPAPILTVVEISENLMISIEPDKHENIVENIPIESITTKVIAEEDSLSSSSSVTIETDSTNVDSTNVDSTNVDSGRTEKSGSTSWLSLLSFVLVLCIVYYYNSISILPTIEESTVSLSTENMSVSQSEKKTTNTISSSKVEPIDEKKAHQNYIPTDKKEMLLRRADSVGWMILKNQIARDLTVEDYEDLQRAISIMENLDQERSMLQFVLTELHIPNPVEYPFDRKNIHDQLLSLFVSYHNKRLQEYTAAYILATPDGENIQKKNGIYKEYNSSVEAYLFAKARQKYPDHMLRMKHVEKERREYVDTQREMHRAYVGYISLIEVLQQRKIEFTLQNTSNWRSRMDEWKSILRSTCTTMISVTGPANSVEQFTQCLRY